MGSLHKMESIDMSNSNPDKGDGVIDNTVNMNILK